MDNLKIKTEDTTDERVLLDIEKPADNKGVVINFNTPKSHEDIQAKPVKKEECEDENTDRNFETIFLPEVYEGIAVETPYFDFNRYKKICGLPAEDHEINPNVTDCINTYNSENYLYRHLKTDNNQMNNDNVYFYSPVPNSYLNTSNDSSFKSEQEWNSRIPMNNLHVNLNVHPQGYYINIHPDNNIHQGDKKLVQGNIISRYKNASETGNESIDKLSRLVDTRIKEVVHHTDISNTPLSDKITETANTKLCDSNKNVSAQLHIGKTKQGETEEAQYKCPICKRPRVFYTLTAVNNHLKFEHISVFRNTVRKLRAIRIPQKTKAHVDGVNVNSA